MRSFALPSLLASFSLVAAQLADKHFTWDSLPYQADTDGGIRGPQFGYNRCNSSTEGLTSLCQTAIINSLDDFCIWGPPEANRSVGDIEGEMVAWCTQPGHGSRVMPDNTLTGVQFTKSPDYVEVVGFMDQTKINMKAGDAGGEMDPHGADARGNPIGGLLFSNAFTGTYIQVVEWHNFNGGNAFCLKACYSKPGSTDRSHELCNNIYDTQGCNFNAPSGARDKVFESCASDNQNPPGAAGGPPASSLCSTYDSTAIYGASASVTVPIPGASTMSFSSISRPPRSTTSGKPSATPAAGGSKTSTGATPSNTSAAMRLDIGFAGIIAAVFSAILIA